MESHKWVLIWIKNKVFFRISGKREENDKAYIKFLLWELNPLFREEIETLF